MQALNKRENDSTERVILKGDHLTPASYGIRKQILGEFDNSNRYQQFNHLLEIINNWSCKNQALN